MWRTLRTEAERGSESGDRARGREDRGLSSVELGILCGERFSEGGGVRHAW